MADIRMYGDAGAFGRALSADLHDAEGLSIAVAFAKQSGLPVVDIERWCLPGRKVRLLAGTNFFLTELELLRRLEMTRHAQCRIYHSIGQQIFHPKLYIIERGHSGIVYVGSSNFTRGGLVENVEVNARVEAPIGDPEVDDARSLFDNLFDGEFATPVSAEFESGYRELQETMRESLANPMAPEAAARFHERESLLLGQYRARVAVKRWLLVVNSENYALCMREKIWGRQQEREVQGYTPGDVFFFHVTGGRGIAAFGIFTGAPFQDRRPLWVPDRRGAFPWRIRLMPLAELRAGIPTREVLSPLRVGAPRNWFHGFIQQSHELAPADFEILHAEFQRAPRHENTQALTPVFDSERPIRSTGDMPPWYTGRPWADTRRSHVNRCVLDSTWEASEAFALDRHPAVAAWVKNDHLGFEIVYVFDGVVRKYRPDFLIRLASGAMLVIEVKGQDSPQNQAKRGALDEWARAVTQHGGFGAWTWAVSRTPSDVADLVAAAAPVSPLA